MTQLLENPPPRRRDGARRQCGGVGIGHLPVNAFVVHADQGRSSNGPRGPDTDVLTAHNGHLCATLSGACGHARG
jgi:hypothetical protein